MSLAATPPHILCLWQQWQRQEQPVIFTGRQWHQGLVVPFASAASAAGGCFPFEVDVSGVSCAFGGEHGRQSMVEFEDSWRTVTPHGQGMEPLDFIASLS